MTLTKEPTAAQKKLPGYQGVSEIKDADYLTKEKWEEQEAKYKERNANRDSKEDREDRRDNRGEERNRGRK